MQAAQKDEVAPPAAAMSLELMNALTECFHLLDIDSSGAISREEVRFCATLLVMG